tara:strand:+ start:4612 stop:7293 length:2682 start_codon:yes stop_codon:yes gene_type:complete
MDAARYQQLKEHFAQARELDPSARAAFLDERCGDDVELRAELEELLASDEQASGGALDRALDATGSVPNVPTEIGPYTLGKLLGEGGMGQVYLAQQKEPFERAVALKLVRPGIESKAVLARFDSERHALARMDHENIARAYDAGATVDGRPYFVMEYVDGIPITDYCDQHRLDTHERLELLAQVCDGLQHAHQKAIIHRDIKPSNVMVTQQNGKPVPKIIDFGVAKASAQPLTQRTLFTELGQIIGTPEYMSPEQADLSGEDVDTRTDIYSLGVLTYEVLVGVLPFDPHELRAAGFDEILRRIREDDPPRPSLRPSTLGVDGDTTLAHRRTTANRLASQLRGDLDWITMKALEKDRGRRYHSAAEMAEDLRRYLRHEPVSAGPPGAAYRTSKFVRRHRISVAFTGLAALFVVAFVVMLVVQSARIADERDRANAEATAQRDLADFLVSLFEDADPGRTKGADVTVRELLDSGAQRIDTLDHQPASQATFRESIGSVYGVMGLFDEGRALLEAANAHREAANDGSRLAELALASSLDGLATVLVRSGEPEAAISLAQRSIEIRERWLGDSPELASSLGTLGNAIWNSGDLKAAAVHVERGLAMRRAIFGNQHDSVAASLHNVASLRFLSEDLEFAETMFREALAIHVSLGDDEGYSHATTLHALAMVLDYRGRPAEALPLEQRSLEIREAVLGGQHPHVALSLTTLARIHLSLGDAEQAAPLAARAAEIGLEAWGPDYPDVWWMQRGHAEALNALERHDEALQIMEPLVARIEVTPRRVELELHLSELAVTLHELERWAEAEPAWRRAIEIADDPDHRDVGTASHARAGLAETLAADGRMDEAIATYEVAVEGFTEVEAGDPRRLETLRAFAGLLRANGKTERAAELEALAESH